MPSAEQALAGAAQEKSLLIIEKATWKGTDLRLLGACTDQPKSAILSSPFMPSSRFSGLMSLWITCFEWQYSRARARDAMYLQKSL